MADTPLVPPAAPAHILLVEDTPGARKLAHRMLLSLGYSVHTAENAAAAILLLDQGELYDVLFTDIVMPGILNGVDLARLARARFPDLKILFTSGYSGMTAKEIAALNAVYVNKPYRKAEIAQILRDLLDG